LFGVCVFDFPAYDDGKLDFVVDVAAESGPGNLVIWSDNDGWRHKKGARYGIMTGGIGQAELEAAFDGGLFYVLAVVSGESDYLLWILDWSEKSDGVDR
jgi:hypothetical protein